MTRLPSFLDDPWSLGNWRADFGHRPCLEGELALLEHVFPAEWRKACSGTLHLTHGFAYQLLTLGGRSRLLHLAAELLRHIGTDLVSGQPRVPMLGRLRDRTLYPPTTGEFLVAPILRPLGVVTAQPQGRGHGADYRIDLSSGALVAEVKRLCTARRQDRTATDRVRADPGYAGPLFTDAEERFNTSEDARRLYPHVKHAAAQLAVSASKAVTVERGATRRDSVPGILFLDRNGKSLLSNLRSRIAGWMTRPWATSIDLVVFFDFDSCDGTWGMVVELAVSRTDRAWRVLAGALRECSAGHLHVSAE